ncbi:7695_t:CDS:2, partial [Cetraspora pellucida]
YDSAEDFSDIDEFDDNEEETLELFIGQVEKFMKKYATAKGYGIRIGGGERTDTTTQKVIKHVYLCHHAEKPSEKMQPNGMSCRVGCLWKVNIWVKKNKNNLEVTTLNDQHVGHELHLLANKEDMGLLLKRLYKKKIEDPCWVFSVEIDPITFSLTHLFWMSPEQQIL